MLIVTANRVKIPAGFQRQMFDRKPAGRWPGIVLGAGSRGR